MLSTNSVVQSSTNIQLTTIQKEDKGEQQKLDKSEINDAVAKVLQGYDWTLVPIATK